MSHALGSDNMAGADMGPGRGDRPDLPQSAPVQESHETTNFVDGSGPIFSMYLKTAKEEDEKMAEGWKADADSILVFTGLFSAAVASLISVSVQDIRPNPQDTSNFYLANIYQTLADPGSNVSTSLPASPPPFTPPNYAIWVNALFFLSLVISISCALLATLLQQWARRYLKVTQPRYSLHKRARIRAFFFEGVEKFLVRWAVEALPTLLHISLFLFFAGISVFLWNVDLTIFKSVVSWIGICTALYGCITLVPILRHDSPYHTPLSFPAWHIVAGMYLATYQVLWWLASFMFCCFFVPFCWFGCLFESFPIFCSPCLFFGDVCSRFLSISFHFLSICLGDFTRGAYNCFKSLKESSRNMLTQGLQRTAEETALNAPSEIDTRALLWTLDSLDEDHELERFFWGLPGFRNSKFVDDPLPGLTKEQKEKLLTALMGLLNVTFSSDLLPDHVKDRRAIICAKAFDPAHIPISDVVYKILSRCQYSHPLSTEIAQIMNEWDNNPNLVAEVCKFIARTKKRDDFWFNLASHRLGVQEPILRDYAAHGDSLSLAVLIHITRQQFTHFGKKAWPTYQFSNVLEAASEFKVQDTSPDLQHEFCALWNQILLKGQRDSNDSMAEYILWPILKVYVKLHQETNSAPMSPWDLPTYPLCRVAGHRPDSTPHVHNDSASTSFASIASSVPAPILSPEVPSSFVPTPPRANESIPDVPPLDNFHPQTTPETTTEALSVPLTSPNPTTTDVIVTPGIIIPHPTSATSTFVFPLSSTSPSLSTAVALQHNPDPLTPSYPPNLPATAAHNPVLGSILLTGSHRPIMVTVTPSASTGPTSAPDLDSAAEDDGSQKPGLHGDKDALDPLLADRAIDANTTPTLVIAGPSMWEPNTERTGDHPPHPSRSQYDIV